jgi:hypothetical protein
MVSPASLAEGVGGNGSTSCARTNEERNNPQKRRRKEALMAFITYITISIL